MEEKKETAKTAAKNRKLSVEESFAALDAMVKKLEDPAVSLEDSFQLYQDGMKILKDVGSTIDKYEKKIRVLMDNEETEEV